MRKDSFKMSKSTKRVMAMLRGTKEDADAYKRIMRNAETIYQTMKTRKVKDKGGKEDAAPAA
jgi:hypothetical protein